MEKCSGVDPTGTEPRRKTFLSFSVSGGAYCYQMGIAAHLQRHFDLSDTLLSGASGGTWPALLLAAGVDVQYAFDVMMEKSVPCYKNRAFGAYGCYDKGMKAAFYHIFDGVDLPAKVNGRLALCVTRIELWPFPHLENEVVSHFYSNDDIIECIIASALIPFALNGRPYVVYRDWICIDGGTTNIAGVRQYKLPSQLDFDEDTTKDDNMHIIARLRTVVSLFSRVQSNFQQLAPDVSSGYRLPHMRMPHFRPFAEFPIQYPMAVEPFGIYGHSVSILNSVVHEVYHSVTEQISNLPSSVQEKIAAVVLLSQGLQKQAGGEKDPTSEEAVGAGVEDSGSALLSRVLPHCLVSWLFQPTAGPALKNTADFSENIHGVNNSWWVRNEFQVQRFQAQKRVLEDGRSTIDNANESVDEVKPLPCIIAGALSYSGVNAVDNGSSVGGSFVQIRGSGQSSSDSLEIADEVIYPTGGGRSSSTTSASEFSEDDSSHVKAVAGPVQEAQRGALCKCTKKANDMGVYWRKKAEAVSVTPCGGTQLLITPWMWRKLPISAYHLTSRGESAAVLLELGFVDAAEHHMELLKFFCPDEYIRQTLHTS